MLTDPIADLLTRITNARMAKHREAAMPYSKLKEALVKLLIKNGYLGGLEIQGDSVKRKLVIKDLRLARAKRLSKPGMRLYIGYRELKPYLRGRGDTILSTAKGLMTAKDASRQKLGGELICRIV